MRAMLLTIWNWLLSADDLQPFYAENLRSDFFNGFLALAGFMLAAKTFIVIHMKQEVYGKEEYAKKFDERKELAGESSATRYGPLERMSNALYWIVVSSVIAAVAQVTIGLVPWNIAALASLGLGAFAIWKLVQGLLLMKANLDSWFELIHDEEEARSRTRTSEPEIDRNQAAGTASSREG